MNLKEYAEERKITFSKVKSVSKTVFGEIVGELSDEQIAKLDAAIHETSKQYLPPSERSDLQTTNPSGITDQQKTEVAATLGVN